MKQNKRAAILKLAHDEPQAELEFELEYMRHLTIQERFDLMFRKSREMAQTLARHGHAKSASITKRT
jgi:Ser/Thr protein kinase RdoA (MazF antagonist)